MIWVAGRILAPLLCFFLLASLSVPAHAQLGRPELLYVKSWAVVIAIDEYLVAPPFQGAVADGKAMADGLRKIGFDEVVEIYNQDARSKTLKNMFTNILPRKVGKQDRVVVFFAGHAGMTKDLFGKDLGYLVPWDAQPTNATKSITLDDLKEFSRRVMSKHVLFFLNTSLSGWDVTPPQQLSLEGRMAPEQATDRKAVQLFTAAAYGEPLVRKDGRGVFVSAVLRGLAGAADGDQNGWIMATELGTYVKADVTRVTEGRQHAQFVRLDGDGDAVLLEGKKSEFRARPEPTTEAERTVAAQEQYELAFALLQEGRSAQEALDRLDKAIGYVPTFGDAYVLKSYVLLDIQPDLDAALAAAELGVKYSPQNPDSHFTLGLIHARRGNYPGAEQAFQQALVVNPQYTDVYLSLGDLYAEKLNDPAKAIASYERYLETGGTENRVVAYLGQHKGGTSPPNP